MLKYLIIENFFSYKERTEINLESSNYGKLKDNIFSIGKKFLMKNMLIYGANASGKTNIIKAIVLMHNFALNKGGAVVSPPFLLDEESKNKPSFFEIGFFIDNKEYLYNFKLLNGIVISENLKEIKGKDYIVLFDRVKNKIIFKDELSNFSGQIEDKVKETTSLLWILDQFNGKLNGKPILHFFKNLGSLGSGVFIPDDTIKLLKLYESKKNRDLVLEFLRCADIDICDIQIKKENRNIVQFDFTKKSIVEGIEEGYRIEIGHQSDSGEIEYFNLLGGHESSGTVKLFGMLGRIITTILNEGVLFIDEIENSLHPHIIKKIFELINNDLGKKYQFIFTTHNIELMNLRSFKKEQIGITEKGSGTKDSRFYTLYDFDDLRSENDIRKLYNLGTLGGVPNITDFSILFKDIKLGDINVD